MELRVFLFAALMFLLMLVSTEAFKCYNCRYVSTLSSPWQNASCTEPFNAASVPTCEGQFCIAIWANFSSPAGSYVLQRTCTNDSSAVTVDQCEKLGDSSRKFFLYDNRCCLLTPNTTVPGDTRRFDQMTCGCQADNCNGAVQYPVMNLSSGGNLVQSSLLAMIMGLMLFLTAIAPGL